MNCEFCNKSFNSVSSLNKHKTTAKYCLKIQGKENVEKDTILCEYCKNTFITDKFLQNHLNICKVKELQEENKNLNQIIKNLEVENIELKASLKIYKSSDECLKEIAKQPKNTTKNTKNTNNNLMYMPVLNLDKDTIRTKIKNNFAQNHLKDGQLGVASFTVDNLLKDQDDNYMYICTDPSRQMFSFKNKNGIIEKDFKANKLTKLISEDVIKQATSLTDDKIETHIKLSEIRELNKDNSKFTSKLSNLLYKPGEIEDTVETDDETDSESDCESNIEEYEEELKKINELDDGSVFFSVMRKKIEQKILEKSA